MDNPEKLTTLGAQDEETQNKNITQYVFGHHYMQANTNNVNKTWAIGGKDELNIDFMQKS